MWSCKVLNCVILYWPCFICNSLWTSYNLYSNENNNSNAASVKKSSKSINSFSPQKRPRRRTMPAHVLIWTALRLALTRSVLQYLRRVNPALQICRVPVASASQHTGSTAKRWLCQKGWRPSVWHLQQVRDNEDTHSCTYYKSLWAASCSDIQFRAHRLWAQHKGVGPQWLLIIVVTVLWSFVINKTRCS